MNAATGNRILFLKGWLGDKSYLKSIDEKYVWHVVQQIVRFNRIFSDGPRILCEKDMGGIIEISKMRVLKKLIPEKIICKKSELGDKPEDTLIQLILDGYDPVVEK